MGLINAAASAVSGALADSWLETIEPDTMNEGTLMVSGVQVRKGKGSNTKSTSNVISNGSVIHVYPNTMMLLIDGGKIVDYCAQEGYYKVSLSSAPSLFNGEFGDALKDTWERFKFGGTPSSNQKVYYINLSEIKGIKFGTKNPVNYFDNFYNSELFLRAHGTYSIKITNPLKFFAEVCKGGISRCTEKTDPFPTSDVTESETDIFFAACWHRYSPKPVDFLSALPLYPVKPFSKMRGKSSGAMPMPVSATCKTFSGVTEMVTLPCGVYLIAFESSCSSRNSIHFSSVKIVIETGS